VVAPDRHARFIRSLQGHDPALLIPEIGQECRVWNSEPLGPWGTSSTQSFPSSKVPAKAKGIHQIQAALTLLGYNPGPIDGALGAKTIAALTAFQRDRGLTPQGTLSAETCLALATALHQARSNDLQALELAMELLNLAKGFQASDAGQEESSCEDGHWITTIASDGGIIILEDNSVWEVALVDAVATLLWLPAQRVLTCGSFLINLTNGRKVNVTPLR